MKPVDQIEDFIKAYPGNWIMSRIGFHGMDASMTLWWAQDHPIILSLRGGLNDIKVNVYFGGGLVACAHKVDFNAPLINRAADRVVDVMQIYGIGVDGICVDDLPSCLKEPVREQLRQRAAMLLGFVDGSSYS